MYVKYIDWSDKENLIADVTVSDNENEIICFSSPCNIKIDENISDTLCCLDVFNFIINKNREEKIIKRNDYYSYLIKGILKDNKQVKVNGFLFNLEEFDLPKDIKVQSYVEFSVSRIDLY